MSTPSAKPVTIPDIRNRKGAAEPLVMLTAYSAPFAEILDPHVDILLVGDSLGMVFYGMNSTLNVSLDMMIAHGTAVARTATHACVIVDMPFGSYQESPEQAYRNAARVMAETGCAAVKLEGGVEMAATIEFLTRRGIPVMGHVGLMPQRVHAYGGFKRQGRDDESRHTIVEDAVAVAEAGAFSIVLEGVTTDTTDAVVQAVAVPVIGIGAGPSCDGQVLVTEDMAGLNTGYVPSFVKQYGNLAKELEQATRSFAQDVRSRRFPDATVTPITSGRKTG